MANKKPITGSTLLLDRARAILGHDVVPGERTVVEKDDIKKISNDIGKKADVVETKVEGGSNTSGGAISPRN